MLFLGMLEASNAYYGDAIGLAPIALSAPNGKEISSNDKFWTKEGFANPTRIACLNYDS